ncbi:DinB family protein [Streptomyces gardneri]|uniref:DinB family protein n=1 Tax=Nocardia TaxID=1817 RepID=UPI00135B0F7F|nr:MULTISPECIES: DinB family protein [Nocardia]MBF6165980.1 DinB family protein [Streptomyces gardneri]MBF6207195.1 DinB family protein [Streptomyces gardneri]UAK31693.1 DinB family protein [Nocardia asteroides]
MRWIAPDIERTEAPLVADERTMLRAWLDRHRDTLLWKCAGLDGDQLRARSVEPSTMSLLGLVRHLTEVERGWFRRAAAGRELGYVYCSEDNPDGDFVDIADADPEAAFAAFRAEIAEADAAVAALPLDHTFRHRWSDDVYTLRWVYLHMIEEYARHNGHADLLRQRIDGLTGD